MLLMGRKRSVRKSHQPKESESKNKFCFKSGFMSKLCLCFFVWAIIWCLAGPTMPRINGGTCVVGFAHGSSSPDVFGCEQARWPWCLLVSYRGPQGDGRNPQCVWRSVTSRTPDKTQVENNKVHSLVKARTARASTNWPRTLSHKYPVL